MAMLGESMHAHPDGVAVAGDRSRRPSASVHLTLTKLVDVRRADARRGERKVNSQVRRGSAPASALLRAAC
jgi:hypothetical protein